MPVYKRDVSSLSKTGSAKLKGDVTLSEGTGVSLTQSGQDIAIAATGGGGGGTVDTVVAGNNIDVDSTDPANPVVAVETLTLADISDVTASTAEVNVLDGIPAGLTATELGYVDGVTSAIQTQIAGKQPLDSDLTTIAGLTATSGNFIVSEASAWASRTPTQVRATLNVEDGADVTDTANVTSAGALMDSEVTSLSGIKSLTVPDSTTISTAAATVTDDSTVADMVNTLGGATSTGTGGLVRATSPAITTPTGIVKGDVGLGNVDNTSDATKNSASATLTNKTIVGANNTISGISPAMRTGGFKVGSFTITASGSKVITGVGFQPKGLQTFVISGGNISGSNASTGFGMTDGTSSGFYYFNVTEGGDASSGGDTTHCVGTSDANSGVDTTATLTSFDADGFTLNCDNYETSITVSYMAFG